MQLFPKDKTIGIFRGFREGGLEFHADLALPYQSTFQNIPMHGQLVLVQLETPNEAVLGRITSLSSDGRLTGAAGEDFNIRAMRESRNVPEQLREDYLKYRVDIRVLGVLRVNGDDKLTFVASHRRLPHVGSPVAFVGDAILKELLGHNGDGAAIGHYAMGEYVFTGGNTALAPDEWVQHLSPELKVKFLASSLVSRRTFVFARAGFGKSNLNKLLFSELYRTDPVAPKRAGKTVPVGTIIFDPDGEYFWPDDKDRPGLADVPHLKDRLVVFTSRKIESKYYMSFVAAGVKLDIRTLSASDVITLALSPEKQDQQNVAKLRSVRGQNWSDLVDLISQDGNSASVDDIKRLLNARDMSDMEVFAARANLTRIVHMLHDPASRLMDALLAALKDGKLCVVDVSQLRGGPALILSGLILRRIFDRNQEEFTKESPQSIPTIAVVEEAQSVLNEKASAAQPYIEWVKEGRKYDLGAMLITQQPGSIPGEILSQGDNWFIFHLLSAADLRSVKGANAHYSDDLLSSLLNEPIPGHGVFWSSVGGRPFPIPFRAMLFEGLYKTVDPTYSAAAVDTYASHLRDRLGAEVAAVTSPPTKASAASPDLASEPDTGVDYEEEGTPVDFRAEAIRVAKAKLREDQEFIDQFDRPIGVPWFVLQRKLAGYLPETMTDRDELALQLVTEVLSEVAGEEGVAWHRERRPKKNEPSKTLVWIVKGQAK
ncbi:MAG: ATP-binding protein [Phycisphaerales bacterium JB037]